MNGEFNDVLWWPYIILEGLKISKSFLISNNIAFAWSHRINFQCISFAVEVLLEARYTLFIFHHFNVRQCFASWHFIWSGHVWFVCCVWAACQIALEAEALVKPYGIHLLLLSCMQTEDWLIIRYNFSRKRKKTTHFISSRWHLWRGSTYTLEVLR